MADNLFAWITDRAGEPRLIGTMIGGFHAPLVFSDESTAKLAQALAAEHGRQLGQPVRLVQFTAARVLEICGAGRAS